MSKPVLGGLSLGALGEVLKDYPAYRTRQIYDWICRGAEDFEGMSNLPLSLRRDLASSYELYAGSPGAILKSADGTIKMILHLEDQTAIEAVILKDRGGRLTACLSTQAGCAMGCVFCKTGTLGLDRNLWAPEIAGQFLRLRQIEPGISHVVIMGMGEPLQNLEELKKALDYLMEGPGVSRRRITVSTCGITTGILELIDSPVGLALSLTSAREDLRRRLMPITTQEPLEGLKAALTEYQKATKRQITLEMVLLAGINTSAADARAAATFAQGLDTVVNLIPWNPAPGLSFEGKPLETPGRQEILAFSQALSGEGLRVFRRTERGRDIGGACGQLGGA
ncbi:MAG: 23S rRNA (adenine(2503)-C(2))-methyltransferase RlmN [Treponema sp.]|nr:23S rRNA (adenine(2503)-C(2))-methyltransferase RlmN [Treponema sp.]